MHAALSWGRRSLYMYLHIHLPKLMRTLESIILGEVAAY